MNMQNQPPKEIFKAYDIRGIVDETLTTEVVFDIGRALGTEAHKCGEQIVAVGRDGRLSGPKFIEALTKGLLTTGRDVVDIGQVATPVLYYAAQHIATGSGLMITGSHNPPNYNGIKMVIGGQTLFGDTIQSLRKTIVTGEFHTADKGQFKTIDVTTDYIARILGDIKLQRKLKIVVDCGNGVAGALAPSLLRELGCEVIELFCDVDGNFPNHHPDPSKPENLEDLINTVKSQKADLGVAFDGDGDRLGVVTSYGEIIWPDRQLMLFAKDVLSRNPGAEIIYDVKCTANLAPYVKALGGVPLMSRTGHSFIKAKLKETGAPIAGEMSGHIFFKERWLGFDDGIYAAARLLEILSKENKTADEVFKSLPDSINTPELNILMEEGENYKFVETLQAEAKFDKGNVATIDGLRVDFEDGFGLVRASNTTPSLVIRFEGKSEEAMARIQEEFKKIMLKIKPDLKLPF